MFSHVIYCSRFQFDPVVPSAPPSGGSLIPVRRKPEEPEAVQDGHFLSDVSPTPTHTQGGATGELDSSRSPVLRLFPPLSSRRLGAVNSFVESFFTRPRWRSPKVAWVSTLKACILAAKVRFQ